MSVRSLKQSLTEVSANCCLSRVVTVLQNKLEKVISLRESCSFAKTITKFMKLTEMKMAKIKKLTKGRC